MIFSFTMPYFVRSISSLPWKNSQVVDIVNIDAFKYTVRSSHYPLWIDNWTTAWSEAVISWQKKKVHYNIHLKQMVHSLIQLTFINKILTFKKKSVIHRYSLTSASWPPTTFVPLFFTPHLHQKKHHIKTSRACNIWK